MPRTLRSWSGKSSSAPATDETHEHVLTQNSVGYPGDKGILEISDMLFTVKGPTAGAILMEWNVQESTQGSGELSLIRSAPSFIVSTFRPPFY